MKADQLPKISYKTPLFLREDLVAHWEKRHEVVRSASELEAFIDIVSRDERLRKLPMSAKVAKEALEFYNKAVVDGRYIWDLRGKPETVAKKLGLEVSKEAMALVDAASRMTGPADGNDITIVVAIAIVIIAARPGGIEEVIIDHSQAVELKL